jgi:tryptophan synthase alpha chain
MNAIDELFRRIRAEGGTALMPFITMGDPDLETTVDIILKLEASGADLIELGVPYSDPLADGPVIQRAAERALRNRITILDCIEAAGKARERGAKLPFVLFTYFNPLLQAGIDRVFRLAAERGFSGAIVPDLPMEEDGDAREAATRYGLHLIPLVAPTSKDRVRRIVSRAGGFVYCVSSLGVTGERQSFHERVDEFLDTVKSATDLPVAVGFGISNREQFRAFAKRCDGVIVGSAFVRRIGELAPKLAEPSSRREALDELGRFAAELKD